MAVFVCYRGDCDNLAQQEAGPSLFVVKDALGRDWLCVDTGLTEMPSEGFPQNVVELLQVQRRAFKQGASREGTEMLTVNYPNKFSLRRHLLSTYPPAAESVRRLAQAGWIPLSVAGGIGARWARLTLTDGREAFTISGETEDEVWHRAAADELGPPGAQEKPTMGTTLTVQDIPVPLRTTDDELRVGDTRVPLDVVIREFKAGADADAIARAYPTLELADVYAVLAYYLRHRDEVDAYLRSRREEARKLREEIEAQQPDRDEFREKLLARQAQQEQGHATSGD